MCKIKKFCYDIVIVLCSFVVVGVKLYKVRRIDHSIYSTADWLLQRRKMVFVNSLSGVRILSKLVSSDESEPYTLSPEQINFYNENGYLVIKGLIDFTSLYTYKQHFQRICNGIVPAGYMWVVKEPSLVKKNLKPEEYINKVQEVLYDDVFITYGENPRMLSVLTHFLGDDITAVHSMFINKPPGATFHPPHQDLFYFPFRPAEKIIGAWTAIDDVHLNNGCLFVVPGSHKHKQMYDHGHVKGSLKMYHGILDEKTHAPVDKRIYLEMAPGDTVFLNPYLVHGSGPNVSEHYRKAITFHFAASSCEYIDLRGTQQEHLMHEIEATMKARGLDMPFTDMWRMKSKQVKGVRSHL